VPMVHATVCDGACIFRKRRLKKCCSVEASPTFVWQDSCWHF
jgi:hypothetical protein